jgi:DNA-binding MarR family transcriptional regulator
MSDNEPIINSLLELVSSFMHNSMHDAIRFSKENGWSMTQLHTLMIIHKRGARIISDIGEELGISNAAASQLLDRMVQEQLVARKEDPEDRRVKQISLTENGLRLMKESLTARQAWMHDLADKLTTEEQEIVGPALRILIDKAREYRLDDCSSQAIKSQ